MLVDRHGRGDVKDTKCCNVGRNNEQDRGRRQYLRPKNTYQKDGRNNEQAQNE